MVPHVPKDPLSSVCPILHHIVKWPNLSWHICAGKLAKERMRGKELVSRNAALKSRLENVLRDQRRLVAEVGSMSMLATSSNLQIEVAGSMHTNGKDICWSQVGRARSSQPRYSRRAQIRADPEAPATESLPESPQTQSEQATALARLKQMASSRARPSKTLNLPEVSFTKLTWLMHLLVGKR